MKELTGTRKTWDCLKAALAGFTDDESNAIRHIINADVNHNRYHADREHVYIPDYLYGKMKGILNECAGRNVSNETHPTGARMHTAWLSLGTDDVTRRYDYRRRVALRDGNPKSKSGRNYDPFGDHGVHSRRKPGPV